MRPARPRAFYRSATSRLRFSASLVAAAAAGALVLSQAPVGNDGTLGSRVASASAGTPVAVAEPLRAVASTRVTLRRHKGQVTGDGKTVYIANRTEFRPGRTTVRLPPRVRARAWVVVDLDSGRLLGKHGARTELPQASTIKLLTALTAVRTIAPGTRHKVTRFETSQVCSCSGIKRGRVYRRDALIKAMLLPSANDAAEAVAGSHPRGRRAFYREMNALAREIGAVDTVARNASGLTAAGSHSTARDLVLLLRAALADETVTRFLGMRSAVISTANGRHRHTVWRSTDYVNRYPGALGKSGWTTPAQNTLVVVTPIHGRRIAVASLGAPTGYSTSGARALTTWAARNFGGLRSVGRLPQS